MIALLAVLMLGFVSGTAHAETAESQLPDSLVERATALQATVEQYQAAMPSLAQAQAVAAETDEVLYGYMQLVGTFPPKQCARDAVQRLDGVLRELQLYYLLTHDFELGRLVISAQYKFVLLLEAALYRE